MPFVQADREIMEDIAMMQQRLGTFQTVQLVSLSRHGADTKLTVNDIKTQFETFATEYRQAKEKKDKVWGPTKDTAAQGLADGLPGTTKSVLNAVTVFSKRPVDPLAGSAAAMDMLAGVSSFMGILGPAAGPFGAAAAALFSMVSMILSFCMPKPEDVVTQIEKLLKEQKLEDNDIRIKATASAVKTYAGACAEYMKVNKTKDKDGNIIKVELVDADAGAFADLIGNSNPVEGNIITGMRKVEEWLQKSQYQDLEGWPHILRLLCDSYFQLKCAATEHYFYAFNENYRTLYLGKRPASSASEEDREAYQRRLTNWNNLEDKVKSRRTLFGQRDLEVIKFLTNVVPVARKRGVYVVHATSGAAMYAGSGPRAFQEAKFDNIWKKCARFSIVASPDASYDAWVANTEDNQLHHLSMKDLRIHRSQMVKGGVTYQVNDLWPDPATGGDGKFRFYAAARQDWLIDKKDKAMNGGVQRYDWDGKNEWQRNPWELRVKENMSQIRLVRPQFFNDANGIPREPISAEFSEKIAKGASIIYATLDGAKEIFFAFTDATSNDHQWKVQLDARSYKGIAVDPHFLWVYGPEGVQCTTHAAVLNSLKTTTKAATKPRWLGQLHPNGEEDVRALYPCEDGTLVISYPSSLGQKRYRINLATAVNDAKNALVMDEWEPFPGISEHLRVHKISVYCWPQVNSLMRSLNVAL